MCLFSFIFKVNHLIRLMDGMLANAIHSDAVLHITVVKATNWLENLNVSVKQLVIGHQKKCQHAYVSKNVIVNLFEYVFC